MNLGIDAKTQKFFKWIRSQPCWFGGKFLKDENDHTPLFCTQEWNDQLGEYVSEVSHILRKGSTRRKENIGNVFPNCRTHHAWFETWAPELRKTYLHVGQEYYERYIDETNRD